MRGKASSFTKPGPPSLIIKKSVGFQLPVKDFKLLKHFVIDNKLTLTGLMAEQLEPLLRRLREKERVRKLKEE